MKTESTQNRDGLKTELETLTQATQVFADFDAQRVKQTAEYHKNIKEENLVLVKKHTKELQAAMGIEEKK